MVENGEPFRSSVDGCGEPRRAGANDDEVVQLVGIDWSDQPDAPPELVLVRVAEQLPARAKDDREFFRRDLETLDQGSRAAILDGIEPLVRMTVPSQEIDQPQYVSVGLIPDDDRASPTLDQAHAPQDQRAHDPLAQLRLGDQQCPKPIRRDRDAFDMRQRLEID